MITKTQPLESTFDDEFKILRNMDKIGIVHIAFRVILLALSDYFFGNASEMIDAAFFFYDTDSTYNLWCRLLNQPEDTKPPLLSTYEDTGIIPPKSEFDLLESLYKEAVLGARR